MTGRYVPLGQSVENKPKPRLTPEQKRLLGQTGVSVFSVPKKHEEQEQTIEERGREIQKEQRAAKALSKRGNRGK